MKILGGIGYILSIIPLVNIVAPVLIGIAWLQAGRRTGQSVFKATGVLMIVSFVVSIGVLVFFFGSILSALAAFPLINGFEEIDPNFLLQVMPGFLTLFTAFLFGAIALGALGIVTFVLEVVSHFRAGRIFQSAWFRRGGWMRIILIVLIILVTVVLVAVALISPATAGDFGVFGGFFFLILLPAVIGGLLANIFSAVAFFTAPD